MNHFPFHIGDFRSGTSNMSRSERWIYRDMLDVYYDREQPLALDVDMLCRDIGVRSTDERTIVAEILDYKFKRTDGGYVHARCEQEIGNYRLKAEIAKKNGKGGGRPKRTNLKSVELSTNPAESDPEPRKTQSVTSPNRELTQQNPAETKSKTNQEPRTNNQEPIKVKGTVELTLDPAGELFDEQAETRPQQAAPPKESLPAGGIGTPTEPKLAESGIIETVFTYWKKTMKSPKAKLDDKRCSVIRRALKAGYSPRDLCRAIQGCSLTPHNQGDNDRGQTYLGIHVCLKDADQIDRFILNAKNPPSAAAKKAAGGAWWVSDANALAKAREVGVGPANYGESTSSWHARIRAAIDNAGKPPAPRPTPVARPIDVRSDDNNRQGPSDVSRAAMAFAKDMLKTKFSVHA
jgi:uncharacterized protein YdaU (DUF1376 family)